MMVSHAERSLTKALALFVVVLLLTTSTATLFMYESDAPVSYQQSVTYHRNLSSSDGETVQITYDGIASVEYNPEFGIGPIDETTGEQETWSNAEEESDVWNVTLQVTFEFTSGLFQSHTQSISVDVPEGYTINSVSVDGTIQDDSVSQTGNTINAISNGEYAVINRQHSGTISIDVGVPFTFHRVFGGWSESQNGGVDYYPGDVIPNNVSDLYAVWIVPTIVATSSDFTSGDTSYTIDELSLRSSIPYSERDQYPTTIHDSGVFGRIYTLDGDITVYNTLPSGTYRNADDSSSMITVSGDVALEGDVVIDDLGLVAGGTSNSNHGDGSGGLFANGNMFIIGPGVTAPSERQANTYLQVYGGHWSNQIGSSGNPVDTDVRIFAGTYYNVVAGSRGATVFGDTHLVMRGGTVLDTVIGGNSGNTSNDSDESSQNRIIGSTYVYMLGDVRMPGDYYEEFYLQFREYPTQEDLNSDNGRTPSIFQGLPVLRESTILTGGSNNGYIGGGTNVYISNDAMLWDVQAGGRRGNSTVVGTASAEVSGNAVVKHVLCGSITDGMDGTNSSHGYNKACVGSTDITVRDGSSVGSVFGAGYDTYYQAVYSSMVGTSTTITITLEGDCVVGYVYGGGYRGTIGTSGDPIGSIRIDLEGGTVLGDVFGGGRGGLDKPIHNQSGAGDISDVSIRDSIRDSTGYSEVYAEAITINVNGGTVNGDIYGGGESVPVIGSYNGFSVNDNLSVQRDDVAAVHANSVSVNITDGHVGGSVYGAGKGVDTQDTVMLNDYSYHRSAFIFAMGPGDTGGWTLVSVPWTSGQGGTTFWSSAEYGDYASTIGNVTVVVSGSGTSVGGSVYGGGEIGRLGPTSGNGGSVSMSIGFGADVTGDVFGGGYGQTGELSSNTLSRTVIVNGATIGGSVYGGSRLGNDNYDGSSTFGHGQAYIYVVSGDIESGTSGNVYGGSYRGYSYMDTHVYIGVPAVSGGGQPASDSLKVHSVYGGASVGESSGFGNDAELLIGNSEVIIGNKAEGSPSSVYNEFSITGDVFGEGDYCAISGNSEVTFRGFSQESQLLSVQKADTLLVEGSDLDILGNVDGSVPQASERLSLNLIGDLVLTMDESWGVSSLDLHSAASQIGGFSSHSADGGFTAPNFSVPGFRINSITLYDGMLMSILGVDNAGVLENPIQGYTLIDNGSSTYYGTFVMGATASVQNGSTGFFVHRDGEYVATQEAHYDYGNVGMTMWYLSGVYKLESTVVLEDDTGIQKDIDVMAPKTVRGSSIQFVGGYINAASPGSLNVVGDLTDATPGEDFLVTVGRYVDDNYLYYYGGEGDPLPGYGGIAAMPDDPVEMQGNGILLNIQIGTTSGFSTTGYAGTVVLHMVERIGDVPINTFDVEVSIYLRTTDSAGQITNVIVMRTDDEYEGGYRYTGSTDVYLPVLSGNHMAEYRISLNGTIQDGGSLTMQTVPTNLNKEGWQTSLFSTPGDVDEGIQNVSLGVGGVFAPVIRFSYDFISETEVGSFDDLGDITLTVELVPEEGWEGSSNISYTIVLSPENAQEMTLSFFDTYLQTAPIGWSDYDEPVFSLELEFGTNMADVHVAVSNSFISGGIRGVTGAADYISDIRTRIGSGDSVLYTDDSGIVHGSSRYVSDTVASNDYTVMTVESFLTYYVQHKPDTGYDQDRQFDYSAHPAWYDTDACMTRFNFESEITNDLDVFAGYSVTIYIIPFTDPDDPNAADKDYTVTPAVILLDQPGVDVDLADIYSTLSITPGYTAVSDEPVWWSYSSTGLQSLENFDEDGVPQGTYIYPLMADSTVYLYLERATYTISVVVDDDDSDDDPGTPLTLGSDQNGFTMTVNGQSVTESPSAQFDDLVTIGFQWDDGYHIERVIGVTANGSVGGFIPTSSGGDNNIEFRMPNGDLSIRVIMTDQNTVTVNLPSDGTSDNGRFGLSISQGESSVVVEIVENSNIKSVSLRTQSDSMSFSGDVTLGTGSFLISAYSDGSELSLLMEPTTTLGLGDLGDNITIDLYVSVKWDITISGDGYGVSRYALQDPLTGERSATADTETYSDGNPCEYVLNGDYLLASSESQDVTLTSLTTNGLTRMSDASDGLGYLVDGTIDVLMSLPVFDVTLRIVLSFTIGGQIGVPGEWGPNGDLIVNGGEVSPITEGQNMIWTGSVSSGDYAIVAEFEGFGIQEREITIGGSNAEVQITLDAIRYTVNWAFPVEGTIHSDTWYVNDVRQIDDFTGNTDAVIWFRSTSDTFDDPVIMDPEDVFEVGIFGEDGAIHLLGVPGLDGEEDDRPSGELDGAILILVEGDINGPHQMNPVDGIDSVVLLSTVVDGEVVTATYTPGEVTAEVSVTGCPEGTGGLILSGGPMNIILISVPGLDAI